MTEEPARVIVQTGSPSSFGWVRRSDYDQGGGQAWERPDGAIQISPPGEKPVVRRYRPEKANWLERYRALAQRKPAP